MQPEPTEIQICIQSSTLPFNECAALVAIYEATQGPDWTNKTNWLEEIDPCSWFGIRCDQGHVTEINLEYNNLNGNLPAELDRLTQLDILNLKRSSMTELPEEIGKLVNLTELIISNNKITKIPSTIGQLSRLKLLNLSNNRTSTIPPEIGQLSSLRTL